MNKHQLSSVLLILTVLGWGVSLALIFPEHVTTLMAIAIIFPMIPAAIVIWIQSSTVPNNVLKEINTLAIKIEHDLVRDRTIIEPNDAPEEILPLINAINRLLRHLNDRYTQERDFSAHASHELRTPLAGIRLQTELALLSNEPSKRDKALRNIMQSVDRATRLVEQLLTISRLTAENVDLATESVNLIALARRVVEDHQTSANANQVELCLAIQPQSLYLEASEQSLTMLVDNLIRNAIAHTPAGGRVTLSLDKQPEQRIAIIRVQDTGTGIPEHLRTRVFERFEKVDKQDQSGTGLGLSIVQRIVELHRGRIELTDGDQGKGLTVTVLLPKIHSY